MCTPSSLSRRCVSPLWKPKGGPKKIIATTRARSGRDPSQALEVGKKQSDDASAGLGPLLLGIFCCRPGVNAMQNHAEPIPKDIKRF